MYNGFIYTSLCNVKKKKLFLIAIYAILKLQHRKGDFNGKNKESENNC